jgi:hypothetical protein
MWLTHIFWMFLVWGGADLKGRISAEQLQTLPYSQYDEAWHEEPMPCLEISNNESSNPQHASWLSMWLSARATKALQMDSCSCWRFHCQLHCNLCFDFQWRATHASTTATNQLFDFRLLQLRCCKLEAKQWTVVTLPFHSIGASMRCIMRNSPWETAYHNTLF